MGGIFGGGSQSTSSSSSSAPWAPQQPYILNSFQDAQNLYNQQSPNGYYTGQTYAPINSTQQQGALTGQNVGQEMVANGGNVSGVGSAALMGLPTASAVGANYALGNFNQGNTGALNMAAGNTPMSLNASNMGILSALRGASGDPTAQNERDASSYANNPVIQQQIASAIQPITDQLSMQTLPGLNAQAVAGGNVDSSRAGAAEGLATLAAQRTASQVASGIQSNAYDTGLQLAENGRATNLNAQLGAAGAANQSTGLGLQGQTSANNNNVANQGIALGGNGQLLSSVGVGNGVLSTGNNTQQQGIADILSSGGILQQNQQNQNNAALQQWQGQQNYPWQLLNNYSNLVAGKNFGGTSQSNGTTTNSGNPLGGILSLGALAAAPFSGGASLGGMAMSGLGSMFGGGSPTINYGNWGD